MIKKRNIIRILFILYCLVAFYVLGRIDMKNQELFGSLSMEERFITVGFSLIGGIIWKCDVAFKRHKLHITDVILSVLCMLFAFFWIITMTVLPELTYPGFLDAIMRTKLLEVVMPFLTINLLTDGYLKE